MFDTRLEMASTWLWWQRDENRKDGEPSARPFSQQPKDVTDPINAVVSRVIRAIDVYDETRDVFRVDLKQVNPQVARLYQGLYPDWETSMTEDKLKELEGTIKVFLHHIRVEGDVPDER